MYDILDDRDYTKLETYIIERPRYAGLRRNEYADMALDELVIDILSEWSNRGDPEYCGQEIPVCAIINRYIQKMRRLRRRAPVGAKLMFTIAIKEAEGLKTVFEKERK